MAFPARKAPALADERRPGYLSPMPRILLATVAGLLGFVLYVGLILALADVLYPLHWALQVVFFVVAGILWVYPAKLLLFWAARQPIRASRR